MKPTETLARETTPEGDELALARRDGVYYLRVDGKELMTSRVHGSEEALSSLALKALGKRQAPRVLVGGPASATPCARRSTTCRPTPRWWWARSSPLSSSGTGTCSGISRDDRSTTAGWRRS